MGEPHVQVFIRRSAEWPERRGYALRGLVSASLGT
jgi:hypothetical protein